MTLFAFACSSGGEKQTATPIVIRVTATPDPIVVMKAATAEAMKNDIGAWTTYENTDELLELTTLAVGLKAKEFTETQVFGKQIQVEYEATDFYGRLIGSVVLPRGKVLNEELVRNGLAWYYRVSPSPSATFERLQYEAWEKRLGFWVESSPTPPWQFRREKIFSVPPVTVNQMDYDLVLNYGIIGDPKSKIYWWPACKDYPEKKDNKIIFGYKQLAKDMGYRSSLSCTQ